MTNTQPATLAEQINDARVQLAFNRTPATESALRYYLSAVIEGGECPSCGLLLTASACPAGCGFYGSFDA